MPLNIHARSLPQHSKMDLVNVGQDVETEKDSLLEAFFLFARGVCGKLQAKGHFADYIDPCSGLPMVHKEGSAVYGEARFADTAILLSFACMTTLCTREFNTFVL